MDISQKEPVYAPMESQNVNVQMVPAPAPALPPYGPPTSSPTIPASLVAYNSPPPSTGLGGLFKKLLFGTGVLLGLAILIGSILMLVKKPVGVKATATIKKADCKKSTDTSSKYTYVCPLEMTYTDADGKEVSVSKTVDTNTYYTAGNKITVYYSKENASEVEIDETNRVLAWVIFGISLALLLGSGIGLFFAFRTVSPMVSPM